MKNNYEKIGNIAKDSIILTVVRCITLLTSMVQTMLLSRVMTLGEYGSYSSLLIIISIGTTFSGLGLSNAINYFYNKENNDFNKKHKYVDTIFALTLVVGIIAALIIYFMRFYIVDYYKNSVLLSLIIYICFRPLFSNIISLYQSLYISIGKSKTIAIRNFLISVVQVVLVPFIFYLTRNLKYVLIVQVILDFLQIIYFGFDFNKKSMKINIKLYNWNLCSIILKYSIPLGLALMLGTLFKESDKLVIGRLMGSEKLAIYTNMSKQLPFEFIVTSFTAVITPLMVRLLNTDKNSAIKVWKNYLKFGYFSTWILCFGAIVCAKELLLFLYSNTYISGLNIFIIYLFVEMFRYTYFGLILTSYGKTKFVLLSSAISLIANIILNIIFYKLIGFAGPAIASLLCTLFMGLIQLNVSCHLLNVKLFDVLDIKDMIILLIKLIFVGTIVYIFKIFAYKIFNNYVIILIGCYGIFVFINLLINKNKILLMLRNLKGD